MDLQTFEDERFDFEALESEPKLGRRQFLIAGLATGAAATALPNYAAMARNRRVPVAKSGTFPLGVASGFPYPKGTILWTQLGDVKRTSRLKLQVAKDRHFKNVVLEKTVTARKERDFTARTRVRDLQPAHEYFYRFHTKDKGSPVGRFRTAPPHDSRQPLKIAFLSCQSFEAGFYNAQAAIAKEPDIDLVLHLGDYIYESHYYPGPRQDTSGFNHDGNVEFLPEYRQKYRLYKQDPDLQAMHAAHNFVSVWDDHEVEDNYADGLASSHAQPGMTNNGLPRRVSIQERRANGYQAYFNYMPRLRFDGDRDRIYEHVRIGKLVDLILTDERQYRDQQPCNDAQLVPCPDQQNPNRTMLGAKQKTWFKQTLAGSPQTWKLWANEVMLMGFQSGPQNGANNDQWDGYAAERKELLDFVMTNNVKNLVPLTGDIHNFFAGTATTDGSDTGTPVCGEFVGGSTTSRGLPEETGIPASTIQSLISALDHHITFTDLLDRGYSVVEVSPTQMTCEFKKVQTQTRDGGQASSIAKFVLPSGSLTPQQVS
ncbi:MAG TPA: alkaline phosphatase D family protein [Solirubrobacterales bacterium]|nr:alkaline phosphatase D family protein [Solirubrobacterales bacterium]